MVCDCHNAGPVSVGVACKSEKIAESFFIVDRIKSSISGNCALMDQDFLYCLPFLTELWVMWILVSCSAFGHYGSPSVTLSPGLLHLLTISGPSFWFCADPPQSHWTLCHLWVLVSLAKLWVLLESCQSCWALSCLWICNCSLYCREWKCLWSCPRVKSLWWNFWEREDSLDLWTELCCSLLLQKTAFVSYGRIL